MLRLCESRDFCTSRLDFMANPCCDVKQESQTKSGNEGVAKFSLRGRMSGPHLESRERSAALRNSNPDRHGERERSHPWRSRRMDGFVASLLAMTLPNGHVDRDAPQPPASPPTMNPPPSTRACGSQEA